MNDEYFKGISRIEYEGPKTRRALAFRHYDPNEMIGGKTLKDHLRFSVAYWHAFRGTGTDMFGSPTILRPWEAGGDPMAVAGARMQAAFEFNVKMQAPFWCFHDRDIAPEGADLCDTNRRLD